MAVYFVDGRGLGAGKTLCTVGRIQLYLKAGRRVATNLDLYLEYLLPADSKTTVTRLPDKPRAIDLDQLGTGDGKPVEEYDESTFGALVLDECGTWLHSRDWNDPDRRALFNWFVHARKRHWDVYLIIQDVDQLDKAIRGALGDYHVRAANTQKIAVPFIGWILRIAGINGLPWKGHVARVNYGLGNEAMFYDRWWYIGKKLYKGFRTGQEFKEKFIINKKGETVDMRGNYTMLSAWHVHGRYLTKQPTWKEQLLRSTAIAIALPIFIIAKLSGFDPVKAVVSSGIMRRPVRQKTAQTANFT